MTQAPIDVPEFRNLQLLQYGTEQDVVDAALAYTQQALPEWRQRTGNTEVVLIQALALMLGPEVLAIQMMPSQILEQLMRMYGIIRDPGSPVSGRVRITVTASAPMQLIPAGTRLRLTLEGTGETVDFLTVEAVQVITTETTSVLVTVQAEYLGVRGDQTPVGTKLDVVDPLPFIESVSVAAAFGGGAGAELDASFYARASATLARLTSTLVLPEHFQYAALTRVGVGRAKVFDLYNPSTPTVTAPGHVTVAATKPDGLPLSPEAAVDLTEWLGSQALASVSIHVIEPTYTTVNFTVSVRATAGTDAAVVKTSVDAALRDRFALSGWDWSNTITPNQIIGLLASVHGVREAITVNPVINLPGKAPMPVIGNIAVTVVA